MEVPLDWGTRDGETISVAALRIPAARPERVGTFWALDGGPGLSGLPYALDDGWVEEIRQAGWDIVIPPHRGTFSPLLDCETLNPRGEECRASLEEEWGEGLQHFNTVQAAHDVGEFIRREKRFEGERSVVYGVSYGTYWAQFYAGEYPEQSSAIILDSAVPTDADLALEEYLVQDVATQLLQTCVDDPVCQARVGFESGEAFSAAVLDAIDNGDCGIGDVGLWEDGAWRFLFGEFINVWQARDFVPLMAAMLSRCDPALTQTVNDAFLAMSGLLSAAPMKRAPIGGALTGERSPTADGTFPTLDILFSGPLQAAVLATTMLSPDAVPAQAELDAMHHFASLGFGTLMRETQAGWGTLPAVDFDRDFVSQTPMLVLNSAYDLQTVFSWAEVVAEQHGAQLVEFSDSQHGVTLSGTGGKSLSGDTCARSIMLAFMDAPGAPVDDTCVEALPQLDVNLDREDLSILSVGAFGTADPWSLLPPPQ